MRSAGWDPPAQVTDRLTSTFVDRLPIAGRHERAHSGRRTLYCPVEWSGACRAITAGYGVVGRDRNPRGSPDARRPLPVRPSVDGQDRADRRRPRPPSGRWPARCCSWRASRSWARRPTPCAPWMRLGGCKCGGTRHQLPDLDGFEVVRRLSQTGDPQWRTRLALRGDAGVPTGPEDAAVAADVPVCPVPDRPGSLEQPLG